MKCCCSKGKSNPVLRIVDIIKQSNAFDRAYNVFRCASKSSINTLITKRSGNIGKLAYQALVDMITSLNNFSNSLIAGYKWKNEWLGRYQAIICHFFGTGTN